MSFGSFLSASAALFFRVVELGAGRFAFAPLLFGGSRAIRCRTGKSYLIDM
jgi:hypothetical protein